MERLRLRHRRVSARVRRRTWAARAARGSLSASASEDDVSESCDADEADAERDVDRKLRREACSEAVDGPTGEEARDSLPRRVVRCDAPEGHHDEDGDDEAAIEGATDEAPVFRALRGTRLPDVPVSPALVGRATFGLNHPVGIIISCKLRSCAVKHCSEGHCNQRRHCAVAMRLVYRSY
eukprot:TRINITY_DN53292_c0_g1_i1.p1 TRINITY_DN53292_c0_g1~~TRINITY_DN53292_c0_g1_i1.p1  ORF type:complete len:180 (+),score=17.25 TRINITY_DN53292_c0_g1_i1:24-563(+)